MEEKNQLVQTIKQWLELEDKIANMSKELRELRKTVLSVSLMSVMKKHKLIALIMKQRTINVYEEQCKEID